jgi:hypothetical protein
VLVAKSPFRIVAFLDYKRLYDRVTYSEVIAYNILNDSEIAPIYIVRSRQPVDGPFLISRYEWGDPVPNPPTWEETPLRQCGTWADLADWECEIRRGGL